MSALGSLLDPHQHLLVVREAATGKHKHVPLSDLGIGPPPDFDALISKIGKPGPASDPRVDQILADVAALKAGAAGDSDPRVDALITRIAKLEMAVLSLAERVLEGAGNG